MISQSRIATRLSWAALVALASITLTVAMTLTARADPPCVLGADRGIDGDFAISADTDFWLTETHAITADRTITWGDFAGEPTINTAVQTLTSKTLTAPVVNTGDMNGGTVDAITSLTVANNVDIGAYDLRAATLTADGLTAGRVLIAGANGLLSDDSDMTFATDTFTVTKIAAFELTGKQTAGATEIEGTAFDINGGAIDDTVIGGGTPAAGSFTTGSFSGNVDLNSTGGLLNIAGAGTDIEAAQADFDSPVEANLFQMPWLVDNRSVGVSATSTIVSAQSIASRYDMQEWRVVFEHNNGLYYIAAVYVYRPANDSVIVYVDEIVDLQGASVTIVNNGDQTFDMIYTNGVNPGKLFALWWRENEA